MLGRVVRWSVAQNSLFEFDCGKFQSSQPLERFSSKSPNHSLSTAVDKNQQFGPCTPMATAAAVTSAVTSTSAARRIDCPFTH
jgi:hypothetical protein